LGGGGQILFNWGAALFWGRVFKAPTCLIFLQVCFIAVLGVSYFVARGIQKRHIFSRKKARRGRKITEKKFFFNQKPSVVFSRKPVSRFWAFLSMMGLKIP
jgi:hypothetical protein